MNEENKNTITDLLINEESSTSKEEVKDIKIDLLREPPLLGCVVGISSSESDDLAQLGLGDFHLKDLLIEISRYLLASGASFAYGGDLRRNGLTEVLIEIVNQYKFSGQDQSNRLRSYLSFPLSLNLTKDDEAKYAHRIKFNKVLPPDDIMPIDLSSNIPPVGAENLYIWSRCLTQMREIMQDECYAKVFIGGRLANYKGIAPGVLEEILISLRKKSPLFLIGGYGGVVGKIVAYLNGEINLDNILAKIKSSPEFGEMYNVYKAHGDEKRMSWINEISDLLKDGWATISNSNGLSIENNIMLSTSSNNYEIIYYLLKGLTTTFKS